MTTAEDEVLPRRAGGFELVRLLGRGGMGVVYEARELASGRRVALKLLLADHALSEEAFERFRREARIAASISDSRCVFVYGAHEIEGAPAIAMELAGGETLEHRIARGEPIPIETAVRWTIEVLEGLEAAAMAGVVHRDVKPSNCFLTADGQVKVGDFGLARTLEADLRLTHTGQFLGSPLYASPEQVKGRAVDQRSDLYSCGATLYALLTGRAPHAGSNFGEVLANILSETPASPRELRPDVPRGLARIVLKALERDPKKRFQTHAEMRTALAAYVSNSSVPGNPFRRGAAFVVDYGLAMFAASLVVQGLAWCGVSVAAAQQSADGRVATTWAELVVLSTTFLWMGAFEATLGATPGKWLFGLRVVGPRPGAAARLGALLRAAVFFAPLWLIELFVRLARTSAATHTQVFLPLELLLGLALFLSMRRRNGWRGVHELLSGTRTIQRRHPFSSLARSLPPPSAPLVGYPGMPQRVGDYVVEGAVGRSPFGVLLQARDSELARSVWVLELEADRAAVPEERRMLARAGRIRWLDALEANDRRYEVFEDPGGASLLACTARGVPIPYTTLLRLLGSLAKELAEADGERVSLHQLWIDRSWNLRVLDASAGAEPGPPLAPMELLVAAAKAMLPRGCVLPRDLPEHAEAVARRVFGLERPFDSVDEARTALQALELRPASVPRRARALQIGLGAGPVVLVSTLTLVVLAWVASGASAGVEAGLMARSLARGTTPVVEGASMDAPGTEVRPLMPSERAARELLVAAWKHGESERFIHIGLSDEERAIVEHAVELHPDPSDEDVERARRERGPLEGSKSQAGPESIGMLRGVPPIAALVWGVASVLGAFLFRGGATFALLDLRLRDRRGRRAGRGWCVLRALLAGLVVFLVYEVPDLLPETNGLGASIVAIGVAAAMHAGLVAASLVDPARGLVDRLLGTRIVPK